MSFMELRKLGKTEKKRFKEHIVSPVVIEAVNTSYDFLKLVKDICSLNGMDIFNYYTIRDGKWKPLNKK